MNQPMTRGNKRPWASRRHQGGLAMIVALIMLVAMTLVGIVLFRQVTAGMLIASNLAFKQSATAAADFGAEDGRRWITTIATPAELQGVGTWPQGYFPAWCYSASGDAGKDCNGASPPQFDFTQFNWDGANQSVAPDDGTGNTVRWVAHRMCPRDGGINDSNQACILAPGAAGGQSKGGGSEGSPLALTQPYFRVTVRAVGPRSTISYIQVMLF